MQFTLQIEVERSEGRNMSSEDVAQELVGLIDGQSVDVGDSVYDVLSVDVATDMTGKANGPALGKVLLELDRAYVIDNLAQNAPMTTTLALAIEHVLTAGAGAIQREKRKK